MKFYYPIDLDSISDFSVFESEFSIPKKPEELYKLRNDIFDSFYNVVFSAEEEVGDATLVAAKICFEFIRIFSLLRLREYTNNLGLTIKCSENSIFYSGNGIPSFPSSGTQIETLKKVSKKAKIKSLLKNIIYNLRMNKNPFYLFNSYMEGMRIINLSPGSMDVKYLKNIGKSSHYISQEVFNPSLEQSITEVIDIDVKEITEITNTLLSSMYTVAKKHGISLPIGEERQSLENTILLRISTALQDLRRVSKIMAKRYGKIHLLCGMNCGYFLRLLNCANRRQGGYSVAFAHGNEVGRWRDMRLELSFCNEFYSYNKQACLDIGKCAELYRLKKYSTPKICSVDDDNLLKFWNKNQKKRNPVKIKNIMLSAFPYDLNMNIDKTFPDIYYLDMEIKLMKPLLKNGFKILYKVHPETLSMPNSSNFLLRLKQYLGKNFEIIFERFENVTDFADAFLFTYTSTTTLNWALCTNKKVVVVDFDEFVRPFSQEAKSLLEKRCTVIPHSFDEKNRLCFDTDILLNAFKESNNSEINTEFMQKYIFP